MATTVNGAFTEFMNNSVNLDDSNANRKKEQR